MKAPKYITPVTKEKVLNKIHTYQFEIPYKIWMLIVGFSPVIFLFSSTATVENPFGRAASWR